MHHRGEPLSQWTREHDPRLLEAELYGRRVVVEGCGSDQTEVVEDPLWGQPSSKASLLEMESLPPSVAERFPGILRLLQLGRAVCWMP